MSVFPQIYSTEFDCVDLIKFRAKLDDKLTENKHNETISLTPQKLCFVNDL